MSTPSPPGALRWWLAGGLTLALGGTALAWWLARPAYRLALGRGSAPVAAVAWTPDGRGVAVGCEDGTVCLLAADGSGEQGRLAGHTGAVRCLALTRDGVLGSGGADRLVKL